MSVIYFLIYLKVWQKLFSSWLMIPKYLDLLPELEIQKHLAKYLKEEKKPPLLPKPLFSSTPLKTKEINKIYDEEKENYLQTAIAINKTDVDAEVESNKEVIKDIIDPTPGRIVDDTLNLNEQFEL